MTGTECFSSCRVISFNFHIWVAKTHYYYSTFFVFDNLVLEFNGKINNSLQLNDTIYLISNPSVNNTANDILKYEGKVLIIDRDNNTITVEQADVDGNIVFEADNYLMFAKQSVINNTGMLGQYAEVKFINNDTAKAELFAVSAEISQSSR